MTAELLRPRWTAYLNAYADVTPAVREELLRESVAEHVVSTNPNGETRGLRELVKHVEQFQSQSPGAYFKNGKLLAHHGQLLSQWTLHRADGAVLGLGHTYARFDEEGRFTHLTGFFQPPGKSSEDVN